MAEPVILGVREESPEGPRISYLENPVTVTTELLNLTEGTKPTEIFRFAARCEEGACRHFDGTNCRLAARIVQILPAVVESLPPCKIRWECRWFRQEGRHACLRCPQVITEVYEPSEEFRRAATPA